MNPHEANQYIKEIMKQGHEAFVSLKLKCDRSSFLLGFLQAVFMLFLINSNKIVFS